MFIKIPKLIVNVLSAAALQALHSCPGQPRTAVGKTLKCTFSRAAETFNMNKKMITRQTHYINGLK